MEYFLLKPNGEQTGTFSLEQVRAMLKAGAIGNEARFWHEGITEWLPIARLEEFIHFQSIQAAPKKPPPAPRTLSGSLARAIPSPHQKPSAGPATPEAGHGPKVDAPRAEKTLEVPQVPVHVADHREVAEPAESEVEPEDWAEEEATSEAPSAPRIETPQPLVLPPSVVVHTGPAALIDRFLVGISLFLGAVAMAYAGWLAIKAADPYKRVTFHDPSVFVLMDQSLIKPFEDDVSHSTLADHLKEQLGVVPDPVAVTRLQIALQQEIARHPAEVMQEYIQAGKAQNIGPGTYRVVGYFDDKGVFIAPRAGEAWVGIDVKGGILYAHRPGTP